MQKKEGNPGNHINVLNGGKKAIFPLRAGDSAGDNYFFLENADEIKKGINVSY